MNLNEFPTLVFFTQAYWNQLGPDMYGSIDKALHQFIDDGGEPVKLKLRKELMGLLGAGDYSHWLKSARVNPEIVKLVGGRFVMPEEIPILLTALETSGRPPS